MTATAPEPSPVERAIGAWATARFSFHSAEPGSVTAKDADFDTVIIEGRLEELATAGDQTAVAFLDGLAAAERVIREAVAERTDLP